MMVEVMFALYYRSELYGIFHQREEVEFARNNWCEDYQEWDDWKVKMIVVGDKIED